MVTHKYLFNKITKYANSVLLEPKQKAELIWKIYILNAELFGGCNDIPGHLEAGMISKININ